MSNSIINSSILITGGTGSFGRAMLKYLTNSELKPKRIVIFSRDELKQWELNSKYPYEKYPNLRFFIGDIRDKDRIQRALEGIDLVIHAAALKQVPTAEYNPGEFIKTNILGAENLINASISMGVKQIIALSTDKAAAPINLYGATKLCSDKLFIAANNIVGSRDIKFSVVRYGNVMGSRGSVIPFFLKKAKEGILPITDRSMTRFNISLEESVRMVIWALSNSLGGELFVPKLKSYKIIDVAEAIGPSCEKPIIGIRAGEKIHEEMITIHDSYSTIQLDKYFAILPPDGRILEKYKVNNINFKNYPKNKSYNSGDNNDFLNINEIRELIKSQIDPKFTPL
tara:strand:- start:670 stop:1692 length:1023 start_codon:yes stop_codon:yes gene_type:complete